LLDALQDQQALHAVRARQATWKRWQRALAEHRAKGSASPPAER